MGTLSERLKQLREKCGWSQEDLAYEAGIRQSFIGALEAGNQKSSGYIPEIAHALGVDAYWLKTGKGNPNGPGVKLSDDELTIIQGFRLAGDEVKEEMLDSARRRLEREAVKTKAA